MLWPTFCLMPSKFFVAPPTTNVLSVLGGDYSPGRSDAGRESATLEAKSLALGHFLSCIHGPRSRNLSAVCRSRTDGIWPQLADQRSLRTPKVKLSAIQWRREPLLARKLHPVTERPGRVLCLRNPRRRKLCEKCSLLPHSARFDLALGQF